jgi:hypothetical protein
MRLGSPATEIDRSRVGAAEQHGDAFVLGRAVASREQRGQRRRAAGLGSDPQHIPQSALCVLDRVVAHQYGLGDIFLRDRKHDLPDLARRPRRRRPQRAQRLPAQRQVRLTDAASLTTRNSAAVF